VEFKLTEIESAATSWRLEYDFQNTRMFFLTKCPAAKDCSSSNDSAIDSAIEPQKAGNLPVESAKDREKAAFQRVTTTSDGG
jgi:hypothetical protein